MSLSSFFDQPRVVHLKILLEIWELSKFLIVVVDNGKQTLTKQKEEGSSRYTQLIRSYYNINRVIMIRKVQLLGQVVGLR